MVSRTSEAVGEVPTIKENNGTPIKGRTQKGSPSPTKREDKPKAKDVAELKDYVRTHIQNLELQDAEHKAATW